MPGIQLFFVPGGQVEITVSAQAMRHFRGERAGRNMVTLLAVLAHSYLDHGEPFSAATPQQIAAETGIPLGDVLAAFKVLEQDGWVAPVTLPEGHPGFHIRLNSSPSPQIPGAGVQP